MTFARHQFELAEPQEDGASLRDHLMAAWRATGKQPTFLANGPKLPEGCEQLWADFLVLHEGRASTGFGPARITSRDIIDWQELTGATLDGWQVDAIRKADSQFMADYARRNAKGGE